MPASTPTAIVAAARAEGRTVLTEAESKQILAAYGIPTVETLVAATEDAAVTAALAIGFPVVLKLHSKTITHKTDVGGVQLNLTSTEAVRDAYRAIESAVRRHAGAEHFQGVSVQPMIKLDGYELIIGSSLDPQFGPVLLFGTGGQLVEVFKDRALGLPPLNTTLARRMMEQTKIFTALKGVRGRRPVDLAALEQLLGPLQPPGRRAALDQGDRHQSLARLAGAASGAGRAGDRPRARRPTTRTISSAQPSARTRPSTSLPGPPRTVPSSSSGPSALRTSH